jgi:hypothetical protein
MVKQPARTQKTFSVHVGTVAKVVKILDDHNLLDEFVLKSGTLKVDLSPFMSFLNQKNVAAPRGGSVHLGAGAAAVRMVHRNFAEEFAADRAATARVAVPPRVVKYAKSFIASKNLGAGNQFAASITQPGNCPPPDPYHCPDQ